MSDQATIEPDTAIESSTLISISQPKADSSTATEPVEDAAVPPLSSNVNFHHPDPSSPSKAQRELDQEVNSSTLMVQPPPRTFYSADTPLSTYPTMREAELGDFSNWYAKDPDPCIEFTKLGSFSFNSDRPNNSASSCSSLASCDISGPNSIGSSDEFDHPSPSIKNSTYQAVSWDFVEHEFSETTSEVNVRLFFSSQDYEQRNVQIQRETVFITLKSRNGDFRTGFNRCIGPNRNDLISIIVMLSQPIDFESSDFELTDQHITLRLIKLSPLLWHRLNNRMYQERNEMCREFVGSISHSTGEDPLKDDPSPGLSPLTLQRISNDRQAAQQSLEKVSASPTNFGDDQENHAHYNRGPVIVDPIGQMIDLNDHLQRERPLRIGYTGLDNLGNTCFMNTILQCLSNTEEVREFFRVDSYENDLNADNPFGCGGKLAKNFSHLIKQLWSGLQFTLSPKHFRNSIGDKFNLFSDFNQHDALEYMEHFMDMLHEDINRVDRRPRIVDPPLPKDENQLTDQEFANEMWMRHKRRNDSLIIDLFHGQLKSKLACPVCPKVSLTFDPFLYLPIQLPKEVVEYSVFFFDKLLCRKPSKITMHLPLESKVNVMLEAISAQTGISHSDMQAYLFKNNEVSKELTSGQILPPPSHSDQLLAVFEVHSDPTETVFRVLVHQRLARPQRPKYCAECKTKTLNPIVCSYCQKVVYCNSNCEYRHSAYHRIACKFRQDLVGFPFVVSIPASQLTFKTLVDRILNCSRYSVDVTEPMSGSASDTDVDMSLESHSQVSSSIPIGVPESSKKGIETASNESDTSPKRTGRTQQTNSSSSEVEPMEIGSLPRTHGMIDLVGFTNQPDLVAEKVSQATTTVLFDSPKFKIGIRPNDLRERLDDGQVLTEQRCGDPAELMRLLTNRSELVLDWQNGHILNRDLLVESKELDHSCHFYDTKRARDDISHTLEDCLRLFTEPEILSLEDSWHCPDCKKPREACKQLTIWRLPKILVIQLKRFAYKNSTREKIKNFVRFPLKGLDMSPFCSPNSPQANQPDECLYDLYAVVNHFGGIYSGHYTTATRTFYNGQEMNWRLFDDCQVEDIDEESIVTKDAYILFYRLQQLNLPASPTSPISQSGSKEQEIELFIRNSP